MLIQTGNERKLASSSAQKGFPGADANFFEGFQAIGNEGGTNHQQAFDAALRELWEFVVRVRGEPRCSSQAGLESHRVFFRRDVRLLNEGRHGLETLGAV